MKIVLSGVFYPLAMLRYFEGALQRRNDVELITVGPFTGSWIPWNGGMHLLPKYNKPPTCPLPKIFITNKKLPYIMLKTLHGDKLEDVDLWLNVDAGWYIDFSVRPEKGIVAHVATDPHCLNYTYQRKYADFFFNMQGSYMEQGDRYLPYAYDPTVHYPMDIKKEYDVCLIGLQYEHRNWVMRKLINKGLKVFYEIGHIFDEYREINCKSRVGFNWSSLQDMNARVWELAAMRICAVQNTVQDMPRFFTSGEDYLEFSSDVEAVEQIEKALADEDLREEIANNAYQKVTSGDNTWDDRVEQLLEEVGLR